MSNSNKILAGIVASVFAVCVTIICVVNVTRNDSATTVSSQVSSTSQSTVQPTEPTVQTTVPSTTAVTTSSVTTSASVSTTASSAELRNSLIGRWTDSAGMSGYEFLADGSVKMTYVNLSAFGVPLDGKADGVYILEGDKLTIKFSIYTATIENTYTISIDGKTLSMYNIKEHETSTYTRSDSVEGAVSSTTVPSTTAVNVPEEILGTWVNADGTVTYTFENTGKLIAVICTPDGVCSTYDGIYLTQENSLVLQYFSQNNTITKSYTWGIEGNVLTLTDENGATVTFTAQVQTHEGQAVSSAEALIGKWSDSAQMSGYEFLSDGTVNVKYVDFTVPVLNIPIKTSVPGSYTVSGDEVTVTHSIYGATISNTYRFSVRDNVLTLINTDDGNTSTYIKKD